MDSYPFLDGRWFFGTISYPERVPQVVKLVDKDKYSRSY